MRTRVIEWRGPAPYYFAPLDEDAVGVVDDLRAQLSYGWGCLYADVALEPGEGDDDARPVAWRTALMPHDGGYVVPLKNAVRLPARLEAGDAVELTVRLGPA